MAAERLAAGKVVSAEAFNLGNGRGYSVLEIIDAARRVTGLDVRYQVGARRAGDPSELVADASHAAQVLGWQPDIVNIDAILATAWRWMTK